MHFSIISCGYNCRYYIDTFYKSIYNQKYSNIDLYIVDDGSTDGGFNYFNYLKDPRIKFFRNKKNMGAAYSRLLAIRSIDRDDTICIQLDADDSIDKNCINSLISVYKNPNIKMTLGNYRNESGIYKGEIYSRYDVDSKLFYRSSNFPAPHLRTFKYELVRNIPDEIFIDNDGFYKYCTDVPLILWCLYQCDKTNYVRMHKPLYHYRSTRKNNTIENFGAREKKDLLRKIYRKLENVYTISK